MYDEGTAIRGELNLFPASGKWGIGVNDAADLSASGGSDWPERTPRINGQPRPTSLGKELSALSFWTQGPCGKMLLKLNLYLKKYRVLSENTLPRNLYIQSNKRRKMEPRNYHTLMMFSQRRLKQGIKGFLNLFISQVFTEHLWFSRLPSYQELSSLFVFPAPSLLLFHLSLPDLNGIQRVTQGHVANRGRARTTTCIFCLHVHHPFPLT